MTQEKEDQSRILGSRYWRAFLIIVSAVFIFGGPYVAYLFTNVLGIAYPFSVISGLVLFVIGILLIWYLIRKKIIS